MAIWRCLVINGNHNALNASGGPQWHSGSGAVLQVGMSLVRSQMVSSEFLIDITFRSHCGPGVGSASNRNEYQENFLGVNAAGA